ncbi:NADH:ubiquinone reductase (Na(+)-transporting) subunit F [Devosia beringensis]|uniref:NADH:ubiquinone reductase (Na(+)-transporting) subunit F n=1 Tax=Devosia beringensis TaxID=2657486 RepID=UPI001E5F1C42|nr:NADH:ubiquinone reductase (Na(+)-transporting) subunit F [Devosia beringensis]
MEIPIAAGFTVLLIVVLAALLLLVRAVLLPSRPVTITLNGERAIETLTNMRLLEALNGNGIAVPSACAGAGSCGLCRVTVTGAEPALPTELALLSRQELRDNVRLACQVVVRGPLAVTVPDDILNVTRFDCTVVSSTSLTPLIKEIVLAPPADLDFALRPGGFVQVTAPPYRLDFADIAVAPAHAAHWERLGLRRLAVHSTEPVTRAYSVANRPQDSGRIVLNIRLAEPPPARPDVMPGIVSSYLFGLATGDSVAISGPYGHFGASDTNKEMIFIGGGVGMAPLRAIIHDQLEARASGRTISFWYGARSRSELYYADQFDDLARRHANFRFVPALSEPSPTDGWDGQVGFIHDVVLRAYLRDHPSPEDCEYYLCGPPLMIGAVFAMLDSCGVERTSIFNDDFGS